MINCTIDETRISDKWMFIFVYPFMALLVVHVGNENSFGELIRIPSYYTDLLLALCTSFFLGFYWKQLFKWLESKFPWTKEPKQRLQKQLFFGVILPSLLAVGIESAYLLMLGIKLQDSSVFYLELPVIVCLCLIINLSYISINYNSQVLAIQKSRTYDKNKLAHKRSFVVQSGKSSLHIPLDDVAYFKIQNKLTFLITSSGKHYLYDFPFKEIIAHLSKNEFFQLNRQIIAKRSSIVKSYRTDTRRLKIELAPIMYEPVFVAKTKASDFGTWLQGA